jgi:hypothetical protein
MDLHAALYGEPPTWSPLAARSKKSEYALSKHLSTKGSGKSALAWAATIYCGIDITLPVVVPIANRAYLGSTVLLQGAEAAARTQNHVNRLIRHKQANKLWKNPALIGALPRSPPGGWVGEGKARFAHRQDQFLNNLCRKLLIYSLNRTLQLSDEALVDTMQSNLAAHGYGFDSMVETIVMSPQFRNEHVVRARAFRIVFPYHADFPCAFVGG